MSRSRFRYPPFLLGQVNCRLTAECWASKTFVVFNATGMFGAYRRAFAGRKDPLTALLLLWASLALTAGPSTASTHSMISYTCRPAPQDVQAFQIELTFYSSSRMKTKILLPNEWAGQWDLHVYVKNLRSVSSHTKISNTDDPAVKWAHHPLDARTMGLSEGSNLYLLEPLWDD